MELIDHYYMNEAIIEAKKALEHDEVPVGAIIVYDGEIIARAHNMREIHKMATHHAEIIAINEACKVLKTWKLVDCIMYVTLEPCIMCTGALILSRIKKVVFGAFDPKSGSVVSVNRVLDHEKYNHRVLYQGGVLNDECGQLLTGFFKQLRSKKNN